MRSQVDAAEARLPHVKRVVQLGCGVLALNVLAAIVAVVLNWPAQFGQVGTSARSDVLAKGTAISAPMLPVAILVVSLLLVRAGRGWTVVGLAGYCLVAILVLIGGLGEAVAAETADTPKAVLVASGIVWAVIAVSMLGLGVAAFRERQRATMLNEGR